jgi:hypothetical protein
MTNSFLIFENNRCSTQISGKTVGALSRFSATSWAGKFISTREPPPFLVGFARTEVKSTILKASRTDEGTFELRSSDN